MIDTETIKVWLDQVNAAVREKADQIEQLKAEVAANVRRRSALEALLEADKSDVSVRGESAPELDNNGSRGAKGLPEAHPPDAHPIESCALEILAERGKPAHISEIHAELKRRGVPIPGKGTDANIIVHLSSSPRICRVGRGLYALRVWSVPEVPPRRRRSSRKKRRPRQSAGAAKQA